MPVYEYVCARCGARFEKLLRSMHTTEQVVCPSCGSDRADRAMSVFAVGESAGSSASRASRPACCQECSGDGTCPMAG